MQNLTGEVFQLDEHRFAGGGFADVWKAVWDRPGELKPQLVAVKVIRDTGRLQADSRKPWNKLIREGGVWSKLNHRYIVPFIGISFDFIRPNTPCLVCPYYKNGNLVDYLLKSPTANRTELATQVAEGLSYLHSLKPNAVIHGDVKATNILIDDNGDACLTDFGLSRVLESSGFTTTNIAGSCRWMAPELLRLQEDGAVPKNSSATDTWAFAMTLIEIFTGRLPFDEIKHDPTIFLSITQGGLPRRSHYPEINNPVWEMMQRCWHQDPLGRPPIRDLVPVLKAFCLFEKPSGAITQEAQEQSDTVNPPEGGGGAGATARPNEGVSRFSTYEDACERVRNFYRRKPFDFNNLPGRVQRPRRLGVWEAVDLLNTMINTGYSVDTLSQARDLMEAHGRLECQNDFSHLEWWDDLPRIRTLPPLQTRARLHDVVSLSHCGGLYCASSSFLDQNLRLPNLDPQSGENKRLRGFDEDDWEQHHDVSLLRTRHHLLRSHQRRVYPYTLPLFDDILVDGHRRTPPSYHPTTFQRSPSPPTSLTMRLSRDVPSDMRYVSMRS